ncbi:hypothetical protein CCE01nite_36950 [Cellulomonas cellasea]|uniref:Uncharacterized protein n=1 Tax=Cellulomonas cellasea TaxID=43670 RepID=A0A4Y3L259_9CELL|nr:hypothetical protein CCE01nite_36950 [Cellulomonas cellasea]
MPRWDDGVVNAEQPRDVPRDDAPPSPARPVGDAPRAPVRPVRDAPLIPTRSADDSDAGWGERADDGNDDRLLRDVPPHW